jgi:hypothetical protein
MADPSSSMSLVELAETRFGGGQILPAEMLLLEETARGQTADCSSLVERRIRSDLISWLCSDTRARGQVTHHGVWLIGADIEGDTGLEHVSVSFPRRSSPHYGDEGTTHSPIATRCMRAARSGRTEL